ncbi:MAG: zinc-ribbon domain-containing protein [Methanobacteriaceae archaeon]|nr:zinc-ribbon domain-containing protein [Methanobacteriaceae archaeon]
MYCHNCGAKNVENAIFCEKCGTKLSEPNVRASKSMGNKTSFTGKNKPSTILVVIGYIFAILGGLIGILIGVYLYTRDNQDSKFHGRNMLVIAAVIICLSVIATSLFSGSLNTPIAPAMGTKNFNNGQFSFDYPDVWNINNTRTDASMTAVDLGDSNMYQTDVVKSSGVVIGKILKSSGRTVEDSKNMFLALSGDMKETSTNYITVDGVTAKESIYTGPNNHGHVTEVRAITWEKGDSTYMIMCIARGSDLGNTLNSQKKYFDTIINSFRTL